MKSKSRYLTITLLSFSLAANAEICSAETSKNDIDAASFYSKSFEIVRRKDLQEFEDGIPIPINHAERVKFSHGGHLGYEKLFLLKKT